MYNKEELKRELNDCLEKIPIVQLACEKVGISRATFYRWCHDDPLFDKLVRAILWTGREVISDLAESTIISLIRDGNLKASQWWLINNSYRYMSAGKLMRSKPYIEDVDDDNED